MVNMESMFMKKVTLKEIVIKQVPILIHLVIVTLEEKVKKDTLVT
uniref:Uncharacterized protein n=1 Tax=viral metagenome TaxID=1070528 RepID=A0A6C0JEG1_9ZZZZ